MGEENTFAGLGTTCFFCKREDIGTDREKWHEAKLDNFKVRDAIEVPELNTGIIAEKREGFPISLNFSFEMAAESMKEFGFALKKAWKQESGSRHYRRKLLKHVSKKALRHYLYELRKRCITSYLP